MVLKTGTYRVGTQTFRIDRSRMSSSSLRRVEFAFNKAKRQQQQQAAQTKAQRLAEIKARKRELLAADERRELKREQTLARRAAEGSRISSEQERFLIDRAQTITLPTRRQTGGGVSSTFEQAVQASRLPLSQRREFRSLRREESKARQELEQARRDIERAEAEQFPGFTGKRPSEILKTKKLLDPARAKQATSVADILRIGSPTSRLLPPLSQGGGGAIRLLHAVEGVPFGGAMEGDLTPESAQSLGFARIQRRQQQKTLETPIGRRATRQSVQTAKAQVIAEPGEVAPPPQYQVLNTRTGETETFKTRTAAEGFSTRQFQADTERVLRQKKTVSGFIPSKTAAEIPVDTGFEVTTLTSTTATTTDSVFPQARPLGVDLPILGRVEEPFISPLLTRGVSEAEQILREQRALGKGPKHPETRKRLLELTGISFEVTGDSPISKPIYQRISQLDLPFIDIKPSVGAQAAITGATLGIAAPLGLLAPVVGGATVGRKTEQTTGSPLLGLVAAGVTAGGISRLQKTGIPRVSLKPVKSKISSFIPKLKKPKLFDAKPGRGLKITGKPFVPGEKLGIQLQGLGKKQTVRIFPSTSKKPFSDDYFNVLIKRKGSKATPFKVNLPKPPTQARSTLSASVAPGGKGFRLSEFVKGAKASSIRGIKRVSKITGRKTGKTDFFIRFGRKLGKKGTAQVSIVKPPLTSITKAGGRLVLTGAAPIVLAGAGAVTPGFSSGLVGFGVSRTPKTISGPVTRQKKARVIQIPGVKQKTRQQIKPISIVEPIIQPIQRVRRETRQIQPTPTPQIPISRTKLILPQPQRPVQRPISAITPAPPTYIFTSGKTKPPQQPRKIPRLPPGSAFGRGAGFKTSGGFKTLSGLATGREVLDLTLGRRKRKKGGRDNGLGRFLM